jgi:phospholipid/cholesterol/gamma-HCH transport system substrate-binding protein
MELGVGLFMVVGIVALAYLSVNLGRVDIMGQRGYVVYADFPSVGGLKSGAAVEIAGVSVGRVQSIGLKDYQARVTLRIDSDVKLQTDAIVSIKTKGLIGEKFVLISPGGSDKIVPAGGRLTEVEAPVDIEELISKYVFGKV